MNLSLDHRILSHWGRVALAGIAAAVLLAGCGGGGGGGGSSSTSGGGTSGGTATITGHLIDKTTTNVLPNRTVTVQGTSLNGVSDASGNFAISSVPVTTITLSVVDSNKSPNGTDGPIDLSKVNGNPKNLGTIVLDVSGSAPPPPPGTGG